MLRQGCGRSLTWNLAPATEFRVRPSSWQYTKQERNGKNHFDPLYLSGGHLSVLPEALFRDQTRRDV